MSLQCQWEVIVKTTGIHVMTVIGCEPRSKIAAFDMDGTIICTKSGRVFALNTDDWQLLYTPQVKQTLQRLYQDEGYKLFLSQIKMELLQEKLKFQIFVGKWNQWWKP